MKHQIGKIINLQQPPKKEIMVVDIPAFEQNPIDDEVLVHHEAKDIKDKGTNKKRFDEFSKLDMELQAILKSNNVSIKGQLEVLDILTQDIIDTTKQQYILWDNLYDLYNRLVYIFTLCWERFNNKDKMPTYSPELTALLTKNYCNSPNIKVMITEQIAYKKKTNMARIEEQKLIDNAIEFVFKFQKTCLQYYIPKWLGVVDNLQKYVAKQKGLKAGNYSTVAKLVENEVMDENLQILTEYGIPQSAVEKIKKTYPEIKTKTEDEVVDFVIKNRISVEAILTEYEKETLKRI